MRWLRWLDSRHAGRDRQVLAMGDKSDEELGREFERLQKELRRRRR